MLDIKGLEAVSENKTILKQIYLNIPKGSIHVLMGKNGSGKSSLAKVIMGHPDLRVVKGSMLFEGKNILKLSPERRAALGIFLAFQNPVEVPGVMLRSYLRLAYNARLPKNRQIPVFKFNKLLLDKCKMFDINPELLSRGLNENLSGGERKKTEILQMVVLKPKFVILDETDSGLDIDAVRSIFSGIDQLKKENPDLTILMISHYEKVFSFIKPDKVHIIEEGVIVANGSSALLNKILKNGYEKSLGKRAK